MAFVAFNNDETEVVGIFNMPQQEPYPEGYSISPIPDDDERVVAFLRGINGG